MNRILLLLCASLFFMQACKDDAVITPEEYLTAHDWISVEPTFTTILPAGDTSGLKSVYSFSEDFTYTFMTENSTDIFSGLGSSPTEGTWSFIDDNRILRLNGLSDLSPPVASPTASPSLTATQELEIVRLDEDEFKIIKPFSFTLTDGSSNVSYIIETYEPKP